ncbi:hypothetical protein [Ferrimicrobium sp.]|uniref:hypothetical protein n=1 Tax=Ferrimicrobium sp. TaxID=2926050 RepID=UPI00263321E6|nr:hypothetical protein [Ferrimicrobium sp.]
MPSRSVHAAVIDEPASLCETQIQLDDPGLNEVEVKGAAAGVFRSDLHVWPGERDTHFLAVLGDEGSE